MGKILSCMSGNCIGVLALTEENTNLKLAITTKDALIHEQMYMIHLLKNKENAEFCLKGGLCSQKDQDVVKEIAQVKKDKSYDSIILSGGGVKSVSFCGALCALEELGVLYDIDHVLKIKNLAGTSGGSIIAALLAVNYNSSDIKQITYDMDMNKIFDDKIGFIRDTVNLIKDYGVAPGDYIYEQMGVLIKAKTGDKDYTLSQLYQDKGINLVLVGTDLNLERSEYFCHNSNNPINRNMSIRTAVRISMSIPFMFEPVKHNGNYCVDGGMLDNYPLHIFDGEYPGEIKARLNMCPPNPKVLGINILSDREIDSYNRTDRLAINSPIQFVRSILTTFLTENERRIMTPSYWYRTASIVTPNYSILDFNLNQNQKEQLVNLGSKYMYDFFKDVVDDVDLENQVIEL